MNKSTVTFMMIMVFVMLASCSRQSSTEHVQPLAIDTSTDEIATRIQVDPIVALSDSQHIYHIDPSRSSASYQVDELLLNTLKHRTISGKSTAISGDLMLDWTTPSNSRVGEISVDLTALTSGSRLRDRRIRTAYLESDSYPIATFVADHDTITFPNSLAAGEEYYFTLPGNLTIRDIQRRVVWSVLLLAGEDEVSVSAELEIQMSDFAVGPIRIIDLLETENEMHLTLDLVATISDVPSVAEVDTHELVTTAPIVGEPEFFADIEPILATNCVACHTVGQIGHGVYAMETAHDVVAVADDLAFVISSGNMPPWPVSEKSPPFEHERRLHSAEIDLIIAWAAAGAPIDGSIDSPLSVSQQPFKPLRSDVVMRLSAPYTPTTHFVDNYRCFMLDPQLTEARYMTGFHIVPTNLQIAHHLTSELESRQRVQGEVARLEAIDSEPGWACSGNSDGVNDGGFQTGFSSVDALSTQATWAPGTHPLHFPQGSGVLLDKDSVFIIQMHYNTSSGTGPDQTELHLQLGPPDADMQAVIGFDMFAPVEIPCPTGIETEACERGSFNVNSNPDPSAAEALLGLCGRTLDDYLGQSADNVTSDCLYEVSIDGAIVIVAAHMHERGKAFNITLNPNTPGAQQVLDIDHWNFDWQGSYKLIDPIQVKVGDIVKVTCVWDNAPLQSEFESVTPYKDSRTYLHTQRIDQLIAKLTGARSAYAHNEIDSDAYRYVSWGYGTDDEMCIGSLAFVSDSGEAATVPMVSLAPPRYGRIAAIIGLLVGLSWLLLRNRDRRSE